MKRIESDAEVVLEPAAPAQAAVIWLHGLGADGFDFVPIVPQLRLSGVPVRFVFPHAPVRPVTLNAGFPMRAWYDIVSLDAGGRADEAGIRESAQRVEAYIAEQIGAGMPSQRIFVAGFSQGGAVALHCALRHAQALGGLIALSTYLPLHSRVAAERHAANQALPVFLAHGQHDPVVPFEWGRETQRILQSLDYAVDWHAYPMQHEVCADEIDDLGAWLRGQL